MTMSRPWRRSRRGNIRRPSGIVTPRGKTVTRKQYIALWNALSINTGGDTAACEHGHFSCAVWDRGPCTDELLTAIEADEGREAVEDLC